MVNDVAEQLNRIREIEEVNFQASRRALGLTYGLFARMLALYDLLGDLVRTSRVPQRDDIVAGVVFLHAARYSLMKGTLELMRAHMMDTFGWIRNATEQAGFADHVRRDPSAAMRWLEAVSSDAAYKRYRKDFKTDHLFSKSDTLMQRLRRVYDFSSQRLHASAHSFATRLKTSSDPESGSTEIRYDYFDIREATDAVRTFLLLMHVHLEIVRVFARLLDDAVQHDRAFWDHQFSALTGELTFQQRRWGPLIDPRLR